MLNISEDEIFTLYEYENLKEEMTYKDILFNIIYDIKHFLGIDILFDKIKEIISQDIFDKYLDYLKCFLDPYINNFNIILDTKEIYNKYKTKYSSNIPNQLYEEHSKLLDEFLSILLEIDFVKNEYQMC